MSYRTYLVYFFLFLFGLSFGSFANVAVDRLPRGRKLLGRSRCDFCRRRLSCWELIPLASFFFLRGRCRSCRRKLPFQYPLVEGLTGALFVAIGVLSFHLLPPTPLGASFQMAYLLAMGFIFWLIFLIDLKEGIIPTQLVVLGVLLTLANYLLTNGYFSIRLYRYLSADNFGKYLLETGFLFNRLYLLWRPLLSGVVSGLLLSGFFFLLVVVTKGRGMGGGDVRFGFLLGLFLGPANTVVAIFTAFLTGSLFALTLILLRRKSFGNTIPFGPFLAFSGLFAFFFGGQVWRWYLTTL